MASSKHLPKCQELLAAVSAGALAMGMSACSADESSAPAPTSDQPSLMAAQRSAGVAKTVENLAASNLANSFEAEVGRPYTYIAPADPAVGLEPTVWEITVEDISSTQQCPGDWDHLPEATPYLVEVRLNVELLNTDPDFFADWPENADVESPGDYRHRLPLGVTDSTGVPVMMNDEYPDVLDDVVGEHGYPFVHPVDEIGCYTAAIEAGTDPFVIGMPHFDVEAQSGSIYLLSNTDSGYFFLGPTLDPHASEPRLRWKF